MKTRKNISGQKLLKALRKEFSNLPDQRTISNISMQDAAMSALAIFKLKFSSLLEFDKHSKDEQKAHNLKSIFGIKNIPSDTQMRTILDAVPYKSFFKIFNKIFSILQNEKVLNQFKYYIPGAGNFFLNPIDGTSFFSSSKVSCSHCLKKKISINAKNIDKQETKNIYFHQLIGTGIVHPDKNIVIPMAPEPILNLDGASKNDCEINAAKRYLHRLKEEHPKSTFLIGGDALFSKTPMVKLIKAYSWSYIMSVKSNSHKLLLNNFHSLPNRKNIVIVEDKIGDKVIKDRKRLFRYQNNLDLAESGFKTNVLEFKEEIIWESKKGTQRKEVYFTWITDIEITDDNIVELMKAGRARWKNENEIFNTLKNQGYNLEHNFGHGKENLSTNFSLFANLAFLLDQIEELTCPLYRKARDVMRTKKGLWGRIQTMIQIIEFDSWTEVIESIALNKKYILKNTS